MQSFSTYVKAYESYKVRNDLGKGITRNEIKELRESYSAQMRKERLAETGKQNIVLANGDRAAKFRALREARVARKAKDERTARIVAMREARKLRTGPGKADPKLPVNVKINEARVAFYKARKALREGDIGMAADQTQVATQAVDAVAAGQGVASPEVVSLVKSLKDQIDALAQTVGVQADTGVTPEADPNAAVPAQADQPLEPVQVMESKVVAEVRARIAERRAKLDAKKAEVSVLVESAATDQILAGMKASVPVDMKLGTVDKSESQLPKEPTVKQVEKGTEPGVVRWPNKAITKDPADGQLGKGAVVKESLPLDELHVERALHEERLDFKKVFKNGSVLVD